MPKSKRNKQVELSKTKKRGLSWKKSLFEEVRSCVDKYANVFVFLVNDMRNSKMKNVREQWRHSRFFIGKNKIMAMALGRSPEEEYKPNLHKLGQEIKGQCGLLFSNKPIEEVLSWFRSYSEGDYARSGNTATETVNLTQGPLAMFPHNLEPYLRQLGLPTTLEKGVIHLIKDHEVCKAGDILTPETAKILKLLGYEMAEFHITIACVWSQDGSYMQFHKVIDPAVKENKKQAKMSPFGTYHKVERESTVRITSSDVENMEINVDGSSDEDEVLNDASNTKQNINVPFFIDSVPHVNTPNSNNSLESSMSDFTKINKSPIKFKMDDLMKTVEHTVDPEKMKSVLSLKTGDSEVCLKADKIESALDLQELDDASIECKMDDTVEIVSDNESDEEKDNKEHDTDEEKDNKEHDADEEKDKEHDEKSHLDITTKTPIINKEKTKRESLLKTPDANTSQDSPVFRELRSRSVKINRKRK